MRKGLYVCVCMCVCVCVCVCDNTSSIMIEIRGFI